MDKNKSPLKIVVVGSGFVGAATAFALTLNGSVAEVVIVDVNRDKAKGEVMDINHGLSMCRQQTVKDGGYEEIRDADIIVITAGSARKPGETRLDLAKKNVGIARSIIKSIMEYYNGGIIIAVSNPVDVLTYLITKESGLPASKIIGSGTILDTSRFKSQIGMSYDVDVANVNAYVFGEHGDSMVPIWSHVSISGIPLEHYDKITKKKLDRTLVEEEVRNSGAKVIQLKGATYYAIAMCVCRIVEAIIKDQNTILCVSSVLKGQHGINDIALSLPAIINANGIETILELELSEQEENKLSASSEKLKEILSQVA
jgi:L-lactate dehydrogenase